MTPVVLALLVCLACGRLFAAEPDKNPLAPIKTLTCTFPLLATASWKTGEAKAEIKSVQEFTVTIEEIDSEGGSAKMGPDHVTALLTATSLHFMDRSLTGSLIFTTVFSLKGPNGALRAVRSRHDYLPRSIPGFVSEPNVSQYDGECTPGQ